MSYATLGDVARIVDCEHKTAPRTDAADPYGYSIGTRAVRGGRLNIDAAKPVDKTAYEEWTRRAVPQPGDLIFSREAPMGEVGEVPKGVRVCLGQRTVLMRPEPDRIDHRYLKYAVMAPQVQQWIDRNAVGSTVLHLNVADVKRIPLPALPEFSTQRRIVEILDDHLSRLDAGVLSLAASLRRSRVLVKSVLLDAIPEFGSYPSHWEASTVDGAGHLELGRQRHPDWHTGPNMRPYLRVANVFEDRIDTSDLMEMHWPEETFERFRLHPGDVLLNEGQSPEWLGRPAIYRGVPEEVAFTNSLLRFQAGESVLPEFALVVFRRHMHAGRFTREARVTTNIAHLSARRLKTVEFPIPPITEQREIVALVDDRLVAVSRLADAARAAQQREGALRRALLAAAFSGRLSGASSDTEVIEETEATLAAGVTGDVVGQPELEGVLW